MFALMSLYVNPCQLYRGSTECSRNPRAPLCKFESRDNVKQNLNICCLGTLNPGIEVKGLWFLQVSICVLFGVPWDLGGTGTLWAATWSTTSPRTSSRMPSTTAIPRGHSSEIGVGSRIVLFAPTKRMFRRANRHQTSSGCTCVPTFWRWFGRQSNNPYKVTLVSPMVGIASLQLVRKDTCFCVGGGIPQKEQDG